MFVKPVLKMLCCLMVVVCCALVRCDFEVDFAASLLRKFLVKSERPLPPKNLHDFFCLWKLGCFGLSRWPNICICLVPAEIIPPLKAGGNESHDPILAQGGQPFQLQLVSPVSEETFVPPKGEIAATSLKHCISQIVLSTPTVMNLFSSYVRRISPKKSSAASWQWSVVLWFDVILRMILPRRCHESSS